jgi:hypothetical protein
LVRLLSATADPTITRPFTIAGGDVTSYSANSNGALRNPRRRSTVPPFPKVAITTPVFASTAIKRPSVVARKILPFQNETPRLVKSPKPAWTGTFASNRHFTPPVTGSSATIFPRGVLRKRVLSTISGVTSRDRFMSFVARGSPVWNVHATARRETFCRLISVRGE